MLCDPDFSTHSDNYLRRCDECDFIGQLEHGSLGQMRSRLETCHAKGTVMTTRKVKLSLLYTTGTPAKWLRRAAARVDEGVALLCANQWQCMQPVPITQPVDAYRHRRLR
jgi:hypothetical protein